MITIMKLTDSFAGKVMTMALFYILSVLFSAAIELHMDGCVYENTIEAVGQLPYSLLTLLIAGFFHFAKFRSRVVLLMTSFLKPAFGKLKSVGIASRDRVLQHLALFAFSIACITVRLVAAPVYFAAAVITPLLHKIRTSIARSEPIVPPKIDSPTLIPSPEDVQLPWQPSNDHDILTPHHHNALEYEVRSDLSPHHQYPRLISDEAWKASLRENPFDIPDLHLKHPISSKRGTRLRQAFTFGRKSIKPEASNGEAETDAATDGTITELAVSEQPQNQTISTPEEILPVASPVAAVIPSLLPKPRPAGGSDESLAKAHKREFFARKKAERLAARAAARAAAPSSPPKAQTIIHPVLVAPEPAPTASDGAAPEASSNVPVAVEEPVEDETIAQPEPELAVETSEPAMIPSSQEESQEQASDDLTEMEIDITIPSPAAPTVPPPPPAAVAPVFAPIAPSHDPSAMLRAFDQMNAQSDPLAHIFQPAQQAIPTPPQQVGVQEFFIPAPQATVAAPISAPPGPAPFVPSFGQQATFASAADSSPAGWDDASSRELEDAMDECLGSEMDLDTPDSTPAPARPISFPPAAPAAPVFSSPEPMAVDANPPAVSAAVAAADMSTPVPGQGSGLARRRKARDAASSVLVPRARLGKGYVLPKKSGPSSPASTSTAPRPIQSASSSPLAKPDGVAVTPFKYVAAPASAPTPAPAPAPAPAPSAPAPPSTLPTKPASSPSSPSAATVPASPPRALHVALASIESECNRVLFALGRTMTSTDRATLAANISSSASLFALPLPASLELGASTEVQKVAEAVGSVWAELRKSSVKDTCVETIRRLNFVLWTWLLAEQGKTAVEVAPRTQQQAFKAANVGWLERAVKMAAGGVEMKGLTGENAVESAVEVGASQALHRLNQGFENWRDAVRGAGKMVLASGDVARVRVALGTVVCLVRGCEGRVEGCGEEMVGGVRGWWERLEELRGAYPEWFSE